MAVAELSSRYVGDRQPRTGQICGPEHLIRVARETVEINRITIGFLNQRIYKYRTRQIHPEHRPTAV